MKINLQVKSFMLWILSSLALSYSTSCVGRSEMKAGEKVVDSPHSCRCHKMKAGEKVSVATTAFLARFCWEEQLEAGVIKTGKSGILLLPASLPACSSDPFNCNLFVV